MVRKKKAVDEVYSGEKLARIKMRYPILTFNVYLFLQAAYEMTDQEIRKLYDVPNNSFNFFKQNHFVVLKEVRQWAR